MSQQQEDSVTVSSISNFNVSRAGDQEQEGRPSLSLSVMSSNQSDADSVMSVPPPALTLNLPQRMGAQPQARPGST